MKINEYNQMMAYLTRPGKILANNINNKKNIDTERQRLAKGSSSVIHVPPKNKKILQYIEDNNIVYGDKKATKAETEAAAKRVESYQDQYNKYFNKKSPKYYNKKIAKGPKPTPNGETTLTSDDWDLIIDSTNFPYELFDDDWMKPKKRVQVEENLFDKYLEMLKAGELLPGTTFEMFEKNYLDFDTDIISKINKRIKDKKQTEGLAALLGISPGKRI